MSLVVAPESAPIVSDADGVMRIGATRVTLDTVVACFHEGVTAEGIADQYPSLSLGQVYAVIAYYLNHRAEVDAYLRNRTELATTVRQENEARWNPDGIRERLLTRKGQG